MRTYSNWVEILSEEAMMRAIEVYERAQQFDVTDVLERYAEETRLPDEVICEHHRELIKFLSLCACAPGNYGMRGPLDELWHTFIIYTDKYASFCDAVAGRFIHHFPVNREDKGQKPADVTYLNFLKDYESAYGNEPPIQVWPRPLGGVDSPSCTNCGAACNHKCIA
jgi:hypothetical protein